VARLRVERREGAEKEGFMKSWRIRMMKTPGTVWILAFLLCLPAVVVAQSPEERIGAVMDRARQAGIPVSLLESKRAEGLAKGIPMDRIATATETRLQQLEKAQQAMARAQDVDAGQLSVGADAISAGVSEAVLDEIAVSAAADRRSAAVAALTHLVSSEGLRPDVALTRVKEALAKGSQALSDLMTRSNAAGRGRENTPNAGRSGRIGPSVTDPGRGALGRGRP
jgi:hypothetical protein